MLCIVTRSTDLQFSTDKWKLGRTPNGPLLTHPSLCGFARLCHYTVILILSLLGSQAFLLLEVSQSYYLYELLDTVLPVPLLVIFNLDGVRLCQLFRKRFQSTYRHHEFSAKPTSLRSFQEAPCCLNHAHETRYYSAVCVARTSLWWVSVSSHSVLLSITT